VCLDLESGMEPEKIAISKFKATCLELLKRVNQTGQPILVTRNGSPIAMIVPPPKPQKPRSWLGSFKDAGCIKGDIVQPAADLDNWQVLGS